MLKNGMGVGFHMVLSDVISTGETAYSKANK